MLVVDSFILSFVVFSLFQDIYFVLKTVEQLQRSWFCFVLFLGGSFSCRLANIQGISYLFCFFMHHYFVTSSWSACLHFCLVFVPVWRSRSSDSGLLPEMSKRQKTVECRSSTDSEDFWTLKQGRKNGTCLLMDPPYKLFLTHEGRSQRRRTRRLLHCSAFQEGNLHVQTLKGLKRTFDTSFFFVCLFL